MTRKELDHHLWMLRQLHEVKEMQRAMKAKAERENSFIKTQVLMECLADMKQRISHYENLIAASSPRVVAFINSVKVPRVRQLLRLRYQYGLPWCQIPQYIGVGISEASCRVRCSRFLRKHCA